MTLPPIEPGSEVPEPELPPEEGAAAAVAEETPPRPPLLVRFWRSLLGWLFGLGMVFLAIVLAAIFAGPIARFEAALAPHFTAVHWTLIGLTAGGILLFVAGLVVLARRGASSLGPEEVEEMLEQNRETMAGPAVAKRWDYRFRGASAGRSVDIELRFGQVKEILRSPGWWRDLTRAGLLAPIAGGLLVFFGVFALIVLHGPPWIKVLFGGWLLYALVRMTWAAARA